jgi:Type I phosphodiesterase / nucleotide pyrophosphatase
MFNRVVLAWLMVAAALSASSQAGVGQAAPHNVVIFVADGLRSRVVNDATAPNLSALARQGVSLVNGHSLFPTFTMANASAIATGHYLGDTGVFSNKLYVGHPVPSAAGSSTPFIENDAVHGDLDEQFGANFLNEDTIGYSTAAIGKHGPTILFDHTDRSGAQTIIFDDITGSQQGIPLSPEIVEPIGPAATTAS